jgi:hypothetical protein
VAQRDHLQANRELAFRFDVTPLKPVFGRDRVSALPFTRLFEGASAAIETQLSGLAWPYLCRGTVGLQDLRHTPLEVFEDREEGPIRDRGAV